MRESVIGSLFDFCKHHIPHLYINTRDRMTFMFWWTFQTRNTPAAAMAQFCRTYMSTLWPTRTRQHLTTCQPELGWLGYREKLSELSVNQGGGMGEREQSKFVHSEITLHSWWTRKPRIDKNMLRNFIAFVISRCIWKSNTTLIISIG